MSRSAPPRAAALAQQRHLHRRTAGRHGEIPITQGRTVGAVQLHGGIDHETIGAGTRMNGLVVNAAVQLNGADECGLALWGFSTQAVRQIC